MSDAIEDLYPLTPLQAGMAFHDLGQRGEGLYVSQLSCELRGELDVEAFAGAWREALARNAVLRGAVAWEGVDEPLFVVLREADLPLAYEDWRGAPAAEIGARFERLLEADRRRGFDLAEAPLLRLWLLRTADDAHRFVFTHHHLLLDGWSLANLLRQVFALYAGRRGGRPGAGAPTPPPFRDYAEWLAARGLGEAEAFFRREFRGFGGPTPLGPPEGARGAGRGRVAAALPPEATRALVEEARRRRLTPNAFVQGAWALSLGGRAGVRDVTYGVVVSGRPPELPGVEEMVGLFINTLPARARWAPGERLVDWLAAQQARALEARGHEHAPLTEVRRWAGAPPGEPLFESVVAFENYPVDAALRAPLPGLAIADVRSTEADHFALSLTAVPGPALRFALGHDLARFDGPAAERLLAQFVRLLGRMAERPEARVGDLWALEGAERRRVVVDWNATRGEFPREARAHDLIAEQARRAPDATAVEGGNERWPYARLEARADALARALLARGAGPGARVGVCLGRSGELAAALLAVLKAGAAYVPLDPAHPPERLAYLLEDSGARLVLADALGDAALPPPRAGLERLRVDGALAADDAAPGAPAPDGGARPLDLAYVIYTSGSTGRPKGVAVTHRSLVNFVTWYARACELGPGDRVPLLAGLSFDASALELWPALASGASVLVPDDEARSRPGRLLAWLAAQKASVAFAPTPLAEALLREPWPEGLALRTLLTGGDALRRRPALGLRARVVNLYGPTEATIVATSAAVDAEADGAPPPIGRPIANARAYVLDDELAPVPVGAPGGLYVGGEGVARGYLGRPALTAERFLPDPFAPEPGARVYATGDRARFLPDGRLEFLGRADRQIKLRGHRIELGEIEAALGEIADVAEGAVELRGDGAEARLVAYAVPRPGRELDPGALRAALARRLPASMLPSAFVRLASLPLTPQGKLDRRALPPPDAPDAPAGAAGDGPRGVTEELLASIWADLLGREAIARGANFFELGGHSLAAMQLASRVRDAFGVELSVRAAFEAPTLRELAALVEGARRDAPALPPVVASPGRGPAPLSFAQARLWFLDRLRPGGGAYNVPFALRLRGPLDVGALRAALAALVERHDALRTVFDDEGGRLSQRVAAPPFELPVEPAEGADDGGLRRLAEAEAGRPFDLARGPLVRAKLWRAAEGDHALLVTAHHIACDAWSLGIFARELASAYAALARGQSPRLPALPVRYADYAAWQRERLGPEAIAGELAWWRARLAGAPPALELPTDRPRPAAQSLLGAHLHAPLPAELPGPLRAFCRGEGVTPFMALLAAFYALLWRQSGQGDLVVGTPAAGRPRPELEPIVGLFLNTLALRVRVDGATSFRELAGRVREATLGALAHQDLPFERLVEALEPRRDAGRSPIFQTMFVYEGPPAALALPGVEASPLDVAPGAAKFDLTLFAREAGGAGGLACTWEYDRALFDAETVGRLAAHYGRLLAGALAEPDRPLGELRLSTETERAHLLAAGRGAAAPPPPARGLHELFEAQVSRSPDAPALRAGAERLSYAELDRRAEQIARRLRARGVRRDVPVGLCARRSLDLAAGVLGVLKAGGACVPLDPSFPAERLARMLRDAGAPLVLAQRSLEPLLPSGGPGRLFFDEIEAAPGARALAGGEGPAAGGEGAGPGDLAYVLYTSGSTGVPKGVAMPHGPLVNLIAWQLGASRAPAATTLQYAALGFDVCFQELFATWAGGGELVLVDEAVRRDPAALLRFVDEGGIERLFLPFVALEALAGAADREGLAPRRLREVMTAGEALRVTPALRRFFARLPGAVLHNHYGPTESHAVTAFTLEGDPRAWPDLPPIGRPITGARAHVLDERLEPAPVGVPGELYLGGLALARGYLGRSAFSAERFVPDPFGPAAGGRLYRSGDLARLLPGGELAFLGRRDAQVKMRGYRVELGEIEAALSAHAGIAACAVDARERPGGGKELVAYAVGRGGPPPPAGELAAFLRERLPDFMLPAAFVALEALPLGPTGKVDQRALPAPDAWGRGGRPPYAEPSTATERRLAELWAELLGAERPGAHDDFFELGGHSLLATRLVARVRDAFGVELPLRELFEATTLRALAGRVDAAATPGEPEPAPRPRTPGEAPALSFAQARLWFLDRLSPGDPAYNLPTALRLRGELDPGALARALAALARRHEALRTTFDERDGAPVARVHDEDFAPPLREIDLRAAGESALAAFAEAEASRPFDLHAGPLLRAALARLDEREHALVLTAHHAVTDGWSTAVVARELSLLYEAFARDEAPRLPPLALQYADYAAWQRARLAGPWLRAELDHWARALEGAPRLELPADRRPAPGAPSRRVGTAAVKVPAPLAARVRALAAEAGCTPFMALLAAYQALLARHAGQDDVSVGTPVAGRTRLEFEPLVGLFVNTLVLRTRVEPAGSFRTLLGRARATCLEAFAHQELPFERLVEALRPERDLSGTPLFRAFFSLLNAPKPEAAAAGLAFAPVALPAASAKFDLSLRLEEREGAFEGALDYRADLFAPATAERLARRLVALLAAAVEGPDAPLECLPLSDEGERATLRSWQPPALEPDALAPTFPAAFAAQAARTPDAPALACGDVSLTYRELDARSSQLAHFLHANGVGPETTVAIFVERSAEMFVAVLGALKAGGAFVPLDPSHPPRRHAAIVEATRPLVTLTQARLLASAPPGAGLLVALDGEVPPGAGLPETAPPGPPPASAAYVIFTSGSTGAPKGVVVEHRQLLAYARAAARRLGLPLGASAATVTSLAADLGYTAVFPTLLGGGCVRVVPEGLVADADGLAEHFARHPVDCLKIVPAHVQALLAAGRPERVLPRLALVFGGEAAPWGLVDRVRELAPGCRVLNHYGPTETTVGVVAGPLDRDEPGELPPVPPLGRPLEGATVHLLDRHLALVPIGALGELYVGGAGVSRGYLGRPALTAERFVPDPFGPPGARLYRTGDLARHLPDGRVTFVGRADRQIKVRGHRVELGEIEAALYALPGVRRAAAALRGGRLVAYVSAGADVAALEAQLRAALLPAALPSAFVELDAWPLLPSGKLDRDRLPEPPEARRARVEPRTPAERRLAAFWSELLGVEQVGADDHFFELGGHSLLATQLVARVRGAFGVDLPLRALFEAPTLAALAARVDASPPCADEPPLRRRDDPASPAPLSPAQERLWFLQRLDPESPAYNVPFALRLVGALDRGALAAALAALAARHEIVRSAFALENGAPVQRVDPSFDLRPRFVDLGALEPAAREAGALALVEADVRRPFAFEQGPPARALLVALGEREHLLAITLHHALTDGWSRAVLTREFAFFYGAFARGEAPRLPPLALQYADYAAWQRARLAGPRLEAQLAYWRRTLAGAPRLELPADRPRPAAPTRRSGSQSVAVPAALAAALERVGRAADATPFMVLLAAFAALLSRHGGPRDVSVGTPVAGRTRAELEPLVGLFVNTLVLRIDLEDDPTFEELVARARGVALNAYEHQDVPFERVVAELGAPRELGQNPLFQTMFVLQNAPPPAPALPGLALEPLAAAAPAAKLDLSLTLAERDGAFEGAFEYDPDRFDAATVARLAERFVVLLRGAAEAPGRRTSELPLLPEAERRRLLIDWNTTAVELPGRDRGIHELVAEQAARTPSALAVAFEDERLTYAELDARAERLAADLRERGVREGDFVPFRLDRRLEVPIAMLGILKAGAAFVPLDLHWPAQRAAQIFAQLGPGVLVTDPSAAHLGPPGRALVLVDAKAPPRDAPALESPPRDAPALESPPRDAPPPAWPADAKAPPRDPPPPARRVDPASPIYAIFTSGSTGTPKGAVVPHRGVTNRFLWMTSAFGAEAARAVLQTTHHVYDSAVWQLFWPLTQGGAAILCAPGREADAAYLAERVARHGVTMTDFVPSVFAAVLPQIAREGARDALRSLRALVVGGEEITAGAAHAFVERFPGVRLVNLYGPTEASIGCIWYTITGREAGRIPIGKPIANAQALVLDERRQPVPIGVPGELYLGGACLGLGYLGDEAKTKAAFVDNPFAEIASAKLYRTGDLARFRADGELEFLGRADRQVKLRGHRVEPGEIEAVLAAHPDVGACAVEPREEPGGDRSLVAYLAPSRGASVEGLEGRVEAFTRERLPAFLVPAHFVALDALPLTASGKLDRRALPSPAPRRPAAPARAPRNERERALVQIWQDELGVAPLGVDDDFFAQGGHSLRAVRALARIEAAIGRPLPLAAFFAHPTVAGLLAALDAPPRGPSPCLVPLRADGDRAPLALVHAIEGHAFAYRELAQALGPGRPVYALRARGLEPGEVPEADVDAMAERYLDELRRARPRGPYVLGGWSLGGVVAFAMAQKLARAGEAPPPLVLIDAFAPSGAARSPEGELAALANLGNELARRAGRDVEALSAAELARLPEADRVAHVCERAFGGALAGEFAALRPEALVRVALANARAASAYQLAPYPGPALLLRARNARRPAPPPPDHGWAPFAPRLELGDVAGDHYSVVRAPHVAALAEAIARWLEAPSD